MKPLIYHSISKLVKEEQKKHILAAEILSENFDQKCFNNKLTEEGLNQVVQYLDFLKE